MDLIENHPFDELKIGDSASLTRDLGARDLDLFAALARELNPAGIDAAAARSEPFRHVVGHGMWGGTLLATLLGTALPGPGTVLLGQSLRFHRPIALGDSLTLTVTVADKLEEQRRVLLDCLATNQRGETVMTGSATVEAPSEKLSRPRSVLPEIEPVERGRRLCDFIAKSAGLEPLRTAVVHPVDALSLAGAVAAAEEKLIRPVLVGPEAKIRAAAAEAGIDLASFELVPTAHSHAAAAAAVAMARAGKVEALMKGAIHTDELMQAVVDEAAGLRTARRISHVFAIDVPHYPRLIFVTDAAINIAPTLEDKHDIVQNAIDLARALGIATPKVALLSAVETVSSKLRSTLDAAALCKMADRGQITGGVLDGPLAFDNAVSPEAAKSKGIVSPVAGQADILVVPDLEAGNILAKQLEYLAEAEVAGIVLGASVPIVLTSRADRTLPRLASCAVALLLARHRQGLAR